MIRSILFSFVIIFSVTSNTYSEDIDQKKMQAVRELVELTGANKLANQFATYALQQSFKIIQEAYKQIPPEVLKIMEDESKLLIDEELSDSTNFIRMMYPVYDKYFTLDEINQMISFNKTPVGQKIIKVTPQLTQDSMKAGERWGQQVFESFEHRLKKRFEKENINLEDYK